MKQGASNIRQIEFLKERIEVGLGFGKPALGSALEDVSVRVSAVTRHRRRKIDRKTSELFLG